MKIRIVSTPAGEAPEWVRAAWVGLILPVDAVLGPRRRVGVISRQPVEHTKCFHVRIVEALAILMRAKPKAAAWFFHNLDPLSVRFNHFVFDKFACEEINDN